MNLSGICNSKTVQRSDRHVDHLLSLQRLKHQLWLTNMGISAMTKSEVVTLTPNNITSKLQTRTNVA